MSKIDLIDMVDIGNDGSCRSQLSLIYSNWLEFQVTSASQILDPAQRLPFFVDCLIDWKL